MISSRYMTIVACLIAAGLAASCSPGGSGKKQDAASGNGGSATEAATPSSNGETATRVAAVKGPIEPCKLFTKMDAQKVLGVPVSDGRISHDTGFAPGTQCSYFSLASADDPGGNWGASLDVSDQATFEKQGSYFKSPTQYFQRTRKGMNAVPASRVKEVKGVGDDAYWEGGHLYVLDRGVALEFRVNANFHIPPGPSEKVDAEEDAAELQAARSLAKSVVLPKLEKM